MRTYRILFVLASLVACAIAPGAAGAAGPSTASHVRPPKTAVTKLTATPSTLPADGGSVMLAATATDAEQGPRPTVYGDSAYGSGPFLEHLAGAGLDSRCKNQPPTAAGGLLAKDAFQVDLQAETVTCPNNVTAAIRRGAKGEGVAYFGQACAKCPLRAQCTTARDGRSVTVGVHEQRLTDARAAQQDPDWQADYRATRPKVERKLGHLMHRKHGGRRARMRGKTKIDADFNLLAAAHNLARLTVLGIRSTTGGWATATA